MEKFKIFDVPLVIARPMPCTFGRVLGLEVGVPKPANPEILIRLLSGQPSHAALIRKELSNSDFKNFENYVRKKHEASRTTIDGLKRALGQSASFMEELSHGHADGPLVPKLLGFFNTLIQISSDSIARFLNVELTCSCCGRDLIVEPRVWWRKADIEFGENEFLFAEYFIQALLGAQSFEKFFASFSTNSTCLDNLEMLCSPDRASVIGNWLREIQEFAKTDSLSGLEKKLQLEGLDIPYMRLKKWSSRGDEIPYDKAIDILRALNVSSSSYRFYAAQTITMIEDFLLSAAPINFMSDRKIVRGIIKSRIQQLTLDFRCASKSL